MELDISKEDCRLSGVYFMIKNSITHKLKNLYQGGGGGGWKSFCEFEDRVSLPSKDVWHISRPHVLSGVHTEPSHAHVDHRVEVVGHLLVRPEVCLGSEQDVVEADEVTVSDLIDVTVVVDAAVGRWALSTRNIEIVTAVRYLRVVIVSCRVRGENVSSVNRDKLTLWCKEPFLFDISVYSAICLSLPTKLIFCKCCNLLCNFVPIHCNAVVTPLPKAASYEPRIAILGIWGDTWLTRGKYSIYVTVRGSYGALKGSTWRLLESGREISKCSNSAT